MRFLKWFYPGLKVKRWVLLILIGIALIAFGTTVALDIQTRFSFELMATVYRLTRRLIPIVGTGVVLIALGVLLVAVGLRETVNSIDKALRPSEGPALVDVVFQRRVLEHGHRVVAIGGGTGLPNLLRGAKQYTSNITAIVTMADDGGSSGRLRESGFPPPGDIRNCLVALAEVEPLMTELFQYRFDSAEEGLRGHSFGNLLIAAMTAITGDFERAVKETSKVLAIRGRVVPATLDNVRLCARLEDNTTVCGQSNVNQAPSRIVRAYLQPSNPTALDEAIRAIEEATLILIGPGSLYSSIIPNLLVPDIARAVRRSRAPKVYICNVMTQPRETLAYRASDHVRALLQHAGTNVADYALINMKRPSEVALARYRSTGADIVEPDFEAIRALGVRPIPGDFINNADLVRHASTPVANAIFHLAEEARQK